MIVFSSLTIRRGTDVLLDNITATINPGQKIGLVGKNGCGKSSLLLLLKNELDADAGNVTLPTNWTLAWVNQETPALSTSALEYVIDGDREYRELEVSLQAANEKNDGHAIATVHSQLDAIGGWSIRARAASLLHGLGFIQKELQDPVSNFSGGWRMRLNLAQALLCRSDLLLLDEPTNHLDLDTIIWLENWLKSYTGTLILVSHDRDFLDPVVDKIFHIDQKKLFEYTGNYTSFEQQRATKLAQQQLAYLHQKQKIDHLQHFVDRFRAIASKAKQAQSRVKMLEKIERLTPAHLDSPFNFTFFPSGTLANPLLDMEKVSAGYEQKVILNNIKLNLVPGSRVGLLGRNGAGKTTLIKLISNELKPFEGKMTLAKGVKVGYFAQHQLELLHIASSPLEHLARIAARHSEQQLRDYLGGFDFRGSRVTQPISHFSGGEKARLVLALIVWQRPSLLLLDEPTNHLDLDMRHALTKALINFDGAILLVSHDRHLLRATTDELLLVHEGKVETFDGDLDDYQKWLNDQQKNRQTQPTSICNDSTNMTKQEENTEYKINQQSTHSKESRKEQKKQAMEQRIRLQPLRKKIEIVEKEMLKLQKQLRDIENTLLEKELYEKARKAELIKLLQNQADRKSELEHYESEWLSVNEQLETALITHN